MREESAAPSLDDAKSLAHFLNISVPQVRKLTRLKLLPVIRVGRSVRFEREAALAVFRAQEQAATDKEAA